MSKRIQAVLATSLFAACNVAPVDPVAAPPGAWDGAARVDATRGGYDALDAGSAREDAPVEGGAPGVDGAAASTDGAPGPVDGGAVSSRLVVVPAGAFMQGCNQRIDVDCRLDELPYRSVTLAAFSIDRAEATQAEWARCVSAGACTTPWAWYDPRKTPHQPVRSVSWHQAVAYCAWQGRRLPTEAEWEKAARGGDGRKFPWGSTAPGCGQANFDVCGGAVVDSGVLLSGASPSGALDMSGNVSEWVGDYYDRNYYSVAPAVDPRGPAMGSARVARGGGYSSSSGQLRASARMMGDPAAAYDAIGLRCAN